MAAGGAATRFSDLVKTPDDRIVLADLVERSVLFSERSVTEFGAKLLATPQFRFSCLS